MNVPVVSPCAHASAVDQPGGRRLAVRAGDVDRRIRQLGMVKQVDHFADAVEDGLGHALGLPAVQVVERGGEVHRRVGEPVSRSASSCSRRAAACRRRPRPATRPSPGLGRRPFATNARSASFARAPCRPRLRIGQSLASRMRVRRLGVERRRPAAISTSDAVGRQPHHAASARRRRPTTSSADRFARRSISGSAYSSISRSQRARRAPMAASADLSRRCHGPCGTAGSRVTRSLQHARTAPRRRGVRGARGAARATARPRWTRRRSKRCQISSVTNGMIGCRTRRVRSSTHASSAAGVRRARRRPVVEALLLDLEAPVAQLGPEEAVHRLRGLGEAVRVERRVHLLQHRLVPREQPALGERQRRRPAAARAVPPVVGRAGPAAKRSRSCSRSAGRRRCAPRRTGCSAPRSPARPGRTAARRRRRGRSRRAGRSTLPSDFDIFRPCGSRTSPLITTSRNGTSPVRNIPLMIIRATQR